MSNLGVNTIAVREFDDMYASDFPRVQMQVRNSTEDLKRGSVVKLNSDGTVSLVDDAGDSVYAILCTDIPAGKVGTAYYSGKFVGQRVIFGENVSSWQAYFDNARKVNIYLADASFPTRT